MVSSNLKALSSPGHTDRSVVPEMHTRTGDDLNEGWEQGAIFLLDKSISLTVLPAKGQRREGFFVEVTPILLLCWLTHPSASLLNSLSHSAPAC